MNYMLQFKNKDYQMGLKGIILLCGACKWNIRTQKGGKEKMLRNSPCKHLSKKAHKIIQYKVDFKARIITRDIEYFIKIQQKDKMILNLYSFCKKNLQIYKLKELDKSKFVINITNLKILTFNSW